MDKKVISTIAGTSRDIFSQMSSDASFNWTSLSIQFVSFDISTDNEQQVE